MDKQEEIQKKIEYKALDSRIKELEQNIMIVEQQISELQLSQISLDELENIKNGTEMRAPIGPGIFVKANLADNKKVLLDLGAKVLCKKSIPEVKEILQQKFDKMAKIHTTLLIEINNLIRDIAKLEQEFKAVP